MDPRFQDLNPLSDAFRREAARNVQQNVGALKSQMDLKDAAGHGPLDEVEDAVVLRAGGSTASGGDEVVVGEGRDKSAASEADRVDAALQAAASQGLLDEKDPRAARRRRARAREMAEQGVPPEILQASRHIVEGQVDPVRGPRASLQGIKTSPETAEMHMQPADYVPVMEIHDQGNRPISVDEDPDD